MKNKYDSIPDVVKPCVTIPMLPEGQKTLVTGGGSGIGKAIAVALGNAGA